jgi:membrane-bound metal-dependent hydrolase YbcI (DUF457 family)
VTRPSLTIHTTMLGRTHALTGAAAWLAAAPGAVPALDYGQFLAGAVVTAGAALVPDFDHPQGTMARSGGIATQAASTITSALAGGHRMGTHSLAASAAATAGAYWLVFMAPNPTWAAWVAAFLIAVSLPLLGRGLIAKTAGPAGLLAAAAVGWAIHTGRVELGWWFVVALGGGTVIHWLGDAITPEGVPVLWPLSRRRLKVPLLTTGSIVEELIAAGLVVVIVALAVNAPAL